MNMRQKSESVPSPIGNNGVKRMFDTAINGHKKGGRESIPNAPLTRVLRSASLSLVRKVLHHICSFQAGDRGVSRGRKQTEGGGGDGRTNADANS